MDKDMTASAFSEFIRNATPEEKALVYAEVLREASEEQSMKVTYSQKPTTQGPCAKSWPDGDGIGPGSGEKSPDWDV